MSCVKNGQLSGGSARGLAGVPQDAARPVLEMHVMTHANLSDLSLLGACIELRSMCWQPVVRCSQGTSRKRLGLRLDEATKGTPPWQ